MKMEIEVEMLTGRRSRKSRRRRRRRRRRGRRGATTWLLFPSPPDHALALQAFSHCKEIADARTAAATLEVYPRRRRGEVNDPIRCRCFS